MTTSRTDMAIRNIYTNILNQILTIILTFLSRTIFLHTLGADYLGINALFSDVLGLLSLADLGFSTAMVYSFYKPLAEKDINKMRALVSFYKRVYMIIAFVVGLVGLMIIPLLPYIVNSEEEIPNLNHYYIFSLINVIATYFCVYKTSILSADQKNYVIVKINMIINIIKTILQIIVLYFYKDYMVYLLTGTICSVLGNVIASKKASKEYPFINQAAYLERDEQKDIFKKVFSAFVYKVSSVLLNATDNLLISVLVGTVYVGYYSNYLLISNKITQFYTLIFSSLIAGIGNLVVKDIPSKRYQIFQSEQLMSNIIACVVIPCYIILVNDFIVLWIGEQYVLEEPVIYAIGINMYLACIFQPLWSFREATGMYQKTKWVMLVCAILNLILSILLGLRCGIFGIILASSMSRILTYVWIEPPMLFKEYFERSSKKYYVDLILNLLLVNILLFISKRLVRYINTASFLDWIFKALIVFLFCLLAAILFYKDSTGMSIVKNKIIKHERN